MCIYVCVCVCVCVWVSGEWAGEGGWCGDGKMSGMWGSEETFQTNPGIFHSLTASPRRTQWHGSIQQGVLHHYTTTKIQKLFHSLPGRREGSAERGLPSGGGVREATGAREARGLRRGGLLNKPGVF